MRSYSSRDVIALIGTVGSHHHFRHPVKPGKVTIAHPKRDIPVGTVKMIARQTQIML